MATRKALKLKYPFFTTMRLRATNNERKGILKYFEYLLHDKDVITSRAAFLYTGVFEGDNFLLLGRTLRTREMERQNGGPNQKKNIGVRCVYVCVCLGISLSHMLL